MSDLRHPVPAPPSGGRVPARATAPLVLRSAGDIRAVLAAREVVRRGAVTVHLRRDQDPSRPGRVAVVAGKRIGGAVLRNRAKRRLRAAVRAEGVPDGVDLILTAGPATPTTPFERLRADLRAATARAARPRGRTP